MHIVVYNYDGSKLKLYRVPKRPTSQLFLRVIGLQTLKMTNNESYVYGSRNAKILSTPLIKMPKITE